MWASRCHTERDEECRHRHLLRSLTSWQCAWHSCCCWTAPTPLHIPSFFCTVSIRLGPAIKLPFFMHNFMLFSLSGSDLSKADSTLHNNHFLPALFERMKEIRFVGWRNQSFSLPNFISSSRVFCVYFPLHSFRYLSFQNSWILSISLTKISN